MKETTRKHPLNFKEDFPYLCVMGIAVAGLGWVIENVLRLIAVGVIDCRYHLLPFISPYGLAVFAVYFLIGEPDDIALFGKKLFKEKTKRSLLLSNLFCFILPCFIVFFGEMLVGHVWEWCFGVELWDYNNQPLHITQYTGILPAVGGGAACYLVIRFMFYPFLRFLKHKLPKKVAVWLACTLGVAIILDTAFISVHSVLFGGAPMYWSVKLK
ncbi:MAG: putative ABC transporter permease [Clostridia bacterium]|nr:putative ABC transporter permease [Clostridia bacterium]